jgi:arabinofuranosyltransferase
MVGNKDLLKKEPALDNRMKCFCIAGFLLFILVFFKNAWICDDAYLNFRSIEQLFNGNGPNWNQHERVQIYTSPLWYLLLAVGRLFSSDPFFYTIIISFTLALLLCWYVYRHLGTIAGGICFFMLTASNAFMDFSTSGLENILSAFLLSISFVGIFKLLKNDNEENRNLIWPTVLALGLLPVCRHDLFFLSLPMTWALIFCLKRSKERTFNKIVLIFVPIILWSVFSLVYYGALFPNTAYAKLNTGIPISEMLTQGLHYFIVTFKSDPFTLVVILLALVLAIKQRQKTDIVLAVALILNLFYILWIGGDFMQGRLFTSAFLLSTLYLGFQVLYNGIYSCKRNYCKAVLVLFIVYMVLFPHTPLNTWLNYSNFNLEHGIADERGYYFDVCSLYAWLYSNPEEIFPDFEWSLIGRQISKSEINYLENDFNGMLGYWAGTEKIIIDRLALGDPFLARIPVAPKQKWRIGHFKREVSDFYRKSLESNRNMFPAGKMQKLYDKVLFATRSKNLFTFDRFKAIISLNLNLF